MLSRYYLWNRYQDEGPYKLSGHCYQTFEEARAAALKLIKKSSIAYGMIYIQCNRYPDFIGYYPGGAKKEDQFKYCQPNQSHDMQEQINKQSNVETFKLKPKPRNYKVTIEEFTNLVVECNKAILNR